MKLVIAMCAVLCVAAAAPHDPRLDRPYGFNQAGDKTLLSAALQVLLTACNLINASFS